MNYDDGRVIRRDLLIAIIVIGVFLLIYLILRLLIPPLQPLRVVSCAPSPSGAPQSLDGHFVDNQMIVIGADQAMTDVLSTTTSLVPNLTLTPLVRCDLGYAGQLPELTTRTAEIGLFQPSDLDSLGVRLYQVGPGTTITAAVDAINRNGAGRRVYADPNYLTAGMLDAEACGNPNSTGGSPNSTGGSPNSTGGSSNGSTGPAASPETYANQWAFEQIGVTSTLYASYEAAQVNFQGDRIRVGVFDTSPFSETIPISGTAPEDVGNLVTFTEPITWVTPEFTLTVVVSPGLPSASSATSGITAVHVISDVSDHGLFVAGLIHAVAPKSDIQLYQVLDQYACGDLYTLITRLHTFISQVEVDKQNGLLNGAVINLSLGILRPRVTDAVTSTVVSTPTDDITDYALYRTPNEQLDQALAILRQDPVKSLLFTIHGAEQLSITVVAAAGNDSWRDENRVFPLAPQLPAAYPFVVGVAGSNANRQRSCFSNWGDVSAPAGEGALGEVPVVSGTNIISVTTSCAASFETPLISVVTNHTGKFPLGYAKWSGTSFATPLVSGLAALVLDAAEQQGRGWMSPSAVAQAIKCGAASADGVINVPTTLLRCMSP